MFKKAKSNISFAELEKEILSFWDTNDIFKKSLKQREGNEEYVFYDGPPFATGLPHYGHLLAGAIKDVVPRYQTMSGKYVDRVFGWDCHGLPVENEMEKELNITSKHEIEEYGVDKFNEACRGIVSRYTSEWEAIVKRIGRWVDFDNGYRTMDKSYMESIWWVFKQLWDKKLIYEGHKILPYCPRCATPLSNFEANQGYKEVGDPSITIRFKLQDLDNAFILAWTTTPWTLPSNLALAVGQDIRYVMVQDGNERYILAKDRLNIYYKKDSLPRIIKEYKGAELCNLRYTPLFPYFKNLKDQGAFRIISGDFVSTQDGTGVVHIAPGFGEDDACVGGKNNIPSVCPIDAECRFTEEISDYKGQFVKDADQEIIAHLKKESLLIHKTKYFHNYPHCWRCESPLIYRAISTWFVNVEHIKDRLLKCNEQITWMPAHIKAGRFGKWLSNAHDWAISRNRYWGCPLPVWENDDSGETICVGSIAELEQLSGKTANDIHKHFIDDIEIKSKSGATFNRVPEVLDCWFESGSMPYAQKHYPFDNKEWLDGHFPADFIAEGLDQTRGWFYTLIVIGGALFDKPPFKNVIVNGLILAEDGRKMSKRLKNYPAPEYIMDKYGADALRLCLLSSSVMRGEDLRFSEKAVKEIIRSVLLPMWNSYSFFTTYAAVDNWAPKFTFEELQDHIINPLDRWIISQLYSLTSSVKYNMDRYHLQSAAACFAEFIDNLTNWYIRRSRRRFWKSQNDNDKDEAYHTLYFTLITFCKTTAPFIPFISESIYRDLKTSLMPDSVHLTDFPVLPKPFSDSALDGIMSRAIRAVSLGRHLRSQSGIRTRQPLNSVYLVSMNANVRHDLESMKHVVAEELNVKNVIIDGNEEKLVNLSAKANFKKLGPKLGKNMKYAAASIAKLNYSEINTLRDGQTIELNIAEATRINLVLDDIEICREEKVGLMAANDSDITVALDLTLTESLKLEGWAREIVNRIQNMRKELNLDVADRIAIKYSAPKLIDKAILEFNSYITEETLATTVINSGENAQMESFMIDNNECCFSIEKS